MTNILCNAFSLNMVSFEDYGLIRVRKVKAEKIPQNIISAIGHADTAAVVSNILGRDIPANRMNISLNEDTVMYVAQYRGPRLPEGATKLPEGATLEFFEVTVKTDCCDGCLGIDCNLCSVIRWAHGE